MDLTITHIHLVVFNNNLNFVVSTIWNLIVKFYQDPTSNTHVTAQNKVSMAEEDTENDSSIPLNNHNLFAVV